MSKLRTDESGFKTFAPEEEKEEAGTPSSDPSFQPAITSFQEWVKVMEEISQKAYVNMVIDKWVSEAVED